MREKCFENDMVGKSVGDLVKMGKLDACFREDEVVVEGITH